MIFYIKLNVFGSRETTEYILKTADEDLCVSDLTLSVIDTPGFDDTDGKEQDACNIHSGVNASEMLNIHCL